MIALKRAAAVAGLAGLAACGGGGSSPPPTYTIGGTVSNLAAGQSVTLSDNGSDSLAVSQNGSFSFKSSVSGAYAVTVTSQPTGQNCTVTGGSGQAMGNVTTVTVSCADITFSVGGTLSNLATGTSVVLDDNGGDALTLTANGSFTFATKIKAGGAYAISVATQPAKQYCTLGNATGTANSNVTGVTVTCERAQYAYVVNPQDNTVSQYVLDANGNLIPLSPATMGGCLSPQNVTLDPVQPYLFVACLSQNFVRTYAIDGTGHLSASAISPDEPTSSPWGVVVNPKIAAAYVLNSGDNSLSASTIGSGGMLPDLTVNNYGAGSAWAGALTPDGANLYITNNGLNSITQYSVGAGGTSLTNLATVTTGAQPAGLALDPAGHFAYIANLGDGTVSQFAIGLNGALTALSPSSVASGNQASSVTLDATGKHAYAVNFSQGAVGTVVLFDVGANGGLNATGKTVTTGKGPVMLALDATGKFAYVPNSADNTVSQYAVASDGSLTPLSIATVKAGGQAAQIAIYSP